MVVNNMLDGFEKDVIERLTRVETKVDNHLEMVEKKSDTLREKKFWILGFLIGIPTLLLSIKEIIV